jgi:hypothetical protein
MAKSKTSWKKGQSGNPFGNTQKPFLAALKVALSEIDPETQQTKLRLISEQLTNLAVAGEPWAIREVVNRVDGRAVQKIEATIDDKRDATDWTRDELVAFLNDARESRKGTSAADGGDRKPDQLH